MKRTTACSGAATRILCAARTHLRARNGRNGRWSGSFIRSAAAHITPNWMQRLRLTPPIYQCPRAGLERLLAVPENIRNPRATLGVFAERAEHAGRARCAFGRVLRNCSIAQTFNSAYERCKAHKASMEQFSIRRIA